MQASIDHRPLIHLAAFLTVLLAATTGFVAPARAAIPGATGRIVFDTDRDGNYEIYTANTSGLNATRLTNNATLDVEPKWSPDGKKIAFSSDRDGNYEIYTMNADGTGQTRVTNNAAADRGPAWSPDGAKIVFQSTRDDSRSEIYTMNAAGTSVVRLTTNPAFEVYPAWSPDGTKIAFMSTRIDGSNDIFTMNADGTNQVALVSGPSTDAYPNWPPDSNANDIRYSSDRNGDFDLYQVASPTTPFQTFGTNTRFPVIAPDGSGRYLFTATYSGTNEIFYWDGDDASALITSSDERFPDWQSLNSNYPRPRGATPLRIPLAPAIKPCQPTTTTHRGSITTPACYNPQPESPYLTVGTPDYNGVGVNSSGYILLKVRLSAPEDGLLTVSITDVRCRGTSGGCANGPLSDYTGNLQYSAAFRITDKNVGATGVGPSASGTTAAAFSDLDVPCTATASAAVGSTCQITTSLNSLYGGNAIVAGKQAVWHLHSADGTMGEVFDGGADGVAGTDPNSLFASGGVFFP